MTKAKTPANFIDPASLHIVDEPYKSSRTTQASKYDAIFSELKPNQRLVCPAGSGSKLSSALKKWLNKKGYQSPLIRARERCEDGNGGVWWLQEEKPKKMETLWQGLGKKPK